MTLSVSDPITAQRMVSVFLRQCFSAGKCPDDIVQQFYVQTAF